MRRDLDVISVGMTHRDPRIHQLEQELHALVAERQQLRAAGTDTPALERNRCEIVTRQQQLSELLISVFGPQPAAA